MPTFTIYITGGMEPFYATLNAVAMFFDSGTLIWEVVWMGAMLALISGAWHYVQKLGGSTMIRTQSWTDHWVMMAIAVTIGFAPCRVVIQDIYGNQDAAPVDNVPVILAVPASLFSSVSYGIFTGIDTAFQGVSGSYMSVSDQGFATPLSLLYSMRGGLETTAPDLSRSLQNYMLDCSRHSAINSQGIATSNNLFDYLLDNGRNEGITDIFIGQGTDANGNPNGTAVSLASPQVVSCSEAKDLLRARFDVFESAAGVDNAGVERLINYNIKQAARPGGGGGSARYTYSDFQNAFNQLLGFTGQTAQNYMRTALIRNIVNDTYRCSNASFSTYAFVNCTQMQSDAMEAYKIDSAASGSLFTKTMFPAMMLLQMLFFAFGVVIFVYGLLRGAMVINYLGKYMLFGMWVFSWLPFVAIINAFIQWMVVEKIHQLPVAGLTSENYATYMYDVLSTNLATASDMLAATPLLTLGLMTGSAMAMANIANRFSARDYVDESQAAPRSATVQPAVQTTPAHQSNAITGVQSADHVDPVFSVANATRAATESAHTQSVSSQIAQMRAAERAVGAMVQDVGGGQWTATDGRTYSLGKMDAVGEAQRTSMAIAEDSQYGKDVTAQIKGFFGALGSGVGVQEAYKHVTSSSAKEAIDKGLDAGTKYAENFVSKADSVYAERSGTLSADTRSVRDAYTDQQSKTTQDVESYKVSVTRSQDTSLRRDLPAATLGTAIAEDTANGGAGQYARRINDAYRQLHEEKGSAADAAYQASLNYLTNNGKTYIPGQEEMAQMMAVQRLQPNSHLQDNIVSEVAAAPVIQGSAYRNAGIGDGVRGLAVNGNGLGSGVPSAVGVTGSAPRQLLTATDLQDRTAITDGVEYGGAGVRTGYDTAQDNFRNKYNGNGGQNLDGSKPMDDVVRDNFLTNQQAQRIRDRGDALASGSRTDTALSMAKGMAEDTAMTAIGGTQALGDARRAASQQELGIDNPNGAPPEITVVKADHGSDGKVRYYVRPGDVGGSGK